MSSNAVSPAPPPTGASEDRTGRWGSIFNLVMMVIGGVFLALLLRHHGWTEFRAMLTGAGGWFALVLGLELISLCMDAAAVHAFMRPEARMIRYVRVLGAQASGRAINVLTPGGALGEPTKLMLLSQYAPQTRALSSLVMMNLAIAYIAVTLMLIGIPITLLLIEVPQPVKVMVGVGLAVIVPAMIGLTLLVRRGAVSSIVDLLRRIRIINDDRARGWREKLVDVDRHIRELQHNRSAGTWKGILWVAGSKIVSWTSSMTLIAAVGVHLSPTVVIGYLSVGLLIGWISQLVPMGLGVQDGGQYALFGILGATGPQGLMVAMLSRARGVAVAILGLVAMALIQIDGRVANHRVRKKLAMMKTQLENGEPVVANPAPEASVTPAT